MERTMIVALPVEHKANFYRLSGLADNLKRQAQMAEGNARAAYGHCLVLFYSIESGCKYLLSRDLKIPMRHEVTKGNQDTCVEDFGHALDQMAKELKVPAAHAPKIGNSFHLSGGYKHEGKPQTFGVATVHEAWRYGLVVERGDQEDLEACLIKFSEWVKTKIEEA